MEAKTKALATDISEIRSDVDLMKSMMNDCDISNIPESRTGDAATDAYLFTSCHRTDSYMMLEIYGLPLDQVLAQSKLCCHGWSWSMSMDHGVENKEHERGAWQLHVWSIVNYTTIPDCST